MPLNFAKGRFETSQVEVNSFEDCCFNSPNIFASECLHTLPPTSGGRAFGCLWLLAAAPAILQFIKLRSQ